MTHKLLVPGPASVQRELLDHFVSGGEAAHIASHETQHANADTEGPGVFGVIIAPALIQYTREIIQSVGDVLQVVTEHINDWVEVAVAAFATRPAINSLPPLPLPPSLFPLLVKTSVTYTLYFLYFLYFLYLFYLLS